MQDMEFDTALVGAALAIAGDKGWAAVTVARAALQAGLDLGRARARFPAKVAVLMRLGVMADQAALVGAAGAATRTAASGPIRDRLFDMIMQRLDVLQTHREGVRAVFRALPTDPGLAMLLALTTRRSMRWLLDAAGIGTDGVRGALRVRGLLVVWLYVVRAWERDDSPDLSATMRALDDALQRAEQAANWLGGADTPEPEVELEPATVGEPAFTPPPLSPSPLSPSPLSPSPLSPSPLSPSPLSPSPLSPSPVSPSPVSPAPMAPPPVSASPVSPAPLPPLPAATFDTPMAPEPPPPPPLV